MLQEEQSPGALSSRVLFVLRAGAVTSVSRGLQQHAPLPPEELCPDNGPPSKQKRWAAIETKEMEELLFQFVFGMGGGAYAGLYF